MRAHTITKAEGRYFVTANGKTEKFVVGMPGDGQLRDATLYQDRIGMSWSGEGLAKLIDLGLWSRETEAGKLKTQPPNAADFFAAVTGESGPVQPTGFEPAKAAAPPPAVAPVIPEAAMAIVAAATSKLANETGSAAASAGTPSTGDAFTPDELAAIMNGKATRSSSQTEPRTPGSSNSTGAYSPEELAAIVNAKTWR